MSSPTSNHNARPPSSRPPSSQQSLNKPKKKYRKLITFLLSCCLFLTVFSACLLGALVLIGKHYIYNNNGTSSNNNLSPSKAWDTGKRNILRLPRDVIPYHYDVTLKPDLQSGNYDGFVNITIDVTTKREDIFVHSVKLKIRGVKLIKAMDDKVVPVQNVMEYEMDEMLRIITKGPVKPGKYYLSIEFSGNMLNKTQGLYMSSYVDSVNGLRKMATSKFEPTYARQAFPCFDEPNMKANFTVHLLKPKDANYIALSNMPSHNETEEENGIMVHFDESVSMSTYLTCFIVSDFQYTKDTIGTDKEFRVYATSAQLAKTNFAREIGKSVIEFFIDYFDIDFPLPKLDLAAIPDFVSGAMEHWGLVTFRETALLYSPEISSSANMQRVATVVSHELAHSWFGNLVTMDWWNDIWLNEGFASYIEYKGVDYARPDWQMMDQFLIADLHPVLILDATLSSHPIVQTVLTPDEITAIFDTISYNKGAAILRMLEDAVGDDAFKHGVTKYLNDHLYGNAVTQDLWDALQANTTLDIDITEFMKTWTVQMGYPVVNVKTEGNNYILTQSRYLTNPDATDTTETPYNYKWMIPVTYITSENSSPELVWFKHTDNQITIEIPSTATWVKFNPNQVGYYRVNYEEGHWNTLIANFRDMSIADRAHLLEESFRLAESGHISYTIPLNLVQNLKNEEEFILWNIALTMMDELKLYLSNSAYLTDFKQFAVDTVSAAYEKLTWTEDNDEGHLKKRARVQVLELACSMGHEECLIQATELFENWLNGSEQLSQDLRSLVYTYGMSSSSPSNWEALYDLFVNETDANEKLKLMYGLTQVRDTDRLTRLIDIAKTDGVIRSQDYFTLLQYIASNPIGTPIVWDYVREDWPALVERFGLNERYLGRMIPSITKRFTTQTKYEEMVAFFEKYPEAGAGASARVQALETVQNNIKWLEKNTNIVENFIANYV